LIVGLMVLASVNLGLFVSLWFLAVAAFLGAGLTFAGATGTCGLAILLLKMPWNRPLAPPSDCAGAVCAAGATPRRAPRRRVRGTEVDRKPAKESCVLAGASPANIGLPAEQERAG
jgi:hypothetical protein